MPTTRRSRVVAAALPDVWAVVGDPYHLPRWWPRVERVEAMVGEKFTELLRAKSGRGVRADFRVEERRKEALVRWRQEIAGTPFERVLASSETEVTLEPAAGGTRVAIALRQRMRGMSRLGGFLVRRASRKLIDQALDGLETAVAR
jgi:uncharacterized protein YndB with AHSA1/START domain